MVVDRNVASYGAGMCQNHSAAVKTLTLNQSEYSNRPLGRQRAMSGAANSMRIICCAIRAEKSATESAQIGDTKAIKAMIQPLIAMIRCCGRIIRTWYAAAPASAASRTGSRFQRESKCPGTGAAPQ